MHILKTLNRAMCWRMLYWLGELHRIGWVRISSLRRWHLNRDQLMRRTQPREDLLSTFLASGTASLSPPSGGLGQWFLTAHHPVLWGCLCSHTVPIPGVRLGLSKTSDPGFKLVTCRTRMCLFLLSSAEFSALSVSNWLLCPDLMWRRKTERKKKDKGW